MALETTCSMILVASYLAILSGFLFAISVKTPTVMARRAGKLQSVRVYVRCERSPQSGLPVRAWASGRPFFAPRICLSGSATQAVLVVTARPAPAACGALVVDQERLRRQGALALRKTRDGFAVDAIRPKGVDRPWSPATAGDVEGETNLLRPAAPRAVDATPSEADLQAEE
jgi:hypothetical protein